MRVTTAIGEAGAEARPPVLEVKGLKKHFPVRAGVFGQAASWVRAVDGVDLTIDEQGHTFGLAGESGCGKSTLGRVILRLLEPTAGEIRFRGQDIVHLDAPGMRRLRRDMQIVFQDPYSALNPRLTIKDIVAEPLTTHLHLGRKEVEAKVLALLKEVGLGAEHLHRFPHEFSGGQRQRIVIARALALNPEFIVLDEPTSALDVSVQAQILNLLKGLRDRLGLSYLLISHDLSVVNHLSDNVAIMYLGQIVEQGRVEDVFRRPLHPYAKALLAAVPVPDPTQRGQEEILEGNVPNPANPPSGCRFHPRCAERLAVCATEEPAMVDLGDGRKLACHLNGRA
ncbi:MAG TPA: oligopeptide/dipeptide ABC transporter ATP-binding protein [Bacillota bacterium]